ncbi:MAG TPA: hypothetical protein VIM70_01490 [Clostridium sp.]|uniref:hypothetical protein n=1 Tax=Clostridium sp. TaxID=1506 RepID=UPI002F938723
MRTIYFNGKLELEDNQDKMNYIITDLVDHTQKSITDILDTIYNSNNTISKLVRVSGRIYNNQHLLTGMGSLFMAKDKFGVMSYHIGSMPLELQLSQLTSQSLELVIEDYTDSVSEVEAYVS